MAAGRSFRHRAVYGNLARDDDEPETDGEEEAGRAYVSEEDSVPDPPETGETEGTQEGGVRSGFWSRLEIAPFTVIGGLLAAFLLVAAVTANASVFSKSAENRALESELRELRDEQARLRIAHEQAFDRIDVERYALGTLGMRSPLPEDLEYFDASFPDRAVIIEPERGDSLLDRIGDFLSGIAAYFPTGGE